MRRAARAAGRGSAAGSPLDELRAQNQQLLAALDEACRPTATSWRRLNAELEETNRGVMALYTQLSDELEETNRGVVALYAELDEKSAQLRAASEAKTRFLANVSHELRAPVTAIIGLTRLLARPASDPLTDEQAARSALIRGSARDLLALVNELLDLAKAESGRLEPRLGTGRPGAVFGQLRGTLRRRWRPSPASSWSSTSRRRRRRAGHRRGAARPGAAQPAAPTRSSSPSEGEVRLSARIADGDDGRDRVADTGIGIPAEQHERIFEEFHQVPGRLQIRARAPGWACPTPAGWSRCSAAR